jgi:hypothetical protein
MKSAVADYERLKRQYLFVCAMFLVSVEAGTEFALPAEGTVEYMLISGAH